jgi:sec-independent protein translocase protein TatA
MGLDNPLHIAFLVVILLLVFGARRLPEIGRSLGSGMREFKQSITGETPPAAQEQATLPPAQQAPGQTAPAQTTPAPQPIAQPSEPQAPPAEPQRQG